MELDKETDNIETVEQQDLEINSEDNSEQEELKELDDTQAVSSSSEELLEEEGEEAQLPDSQEMVKAIALLQEEIINLNQELEKQKEQAKSAQTQYMRLTADFDNFRRRTAKEKEEQDTQIKKKTLYELLAVVDNFERARTQIKPANDGEMAIHKSYQGVYKTFVDSLKKLGVSAMRPEGEPFDPNYQEAMLREPTKEHPEGTVLEQLVRGYMLNDDILRYAMVKVAAPQEDDDEDNISQPDNPQS